MKKQITAGTLIVSMLLAACSDISVRPSPKDYPMNEATARAAASAGWTDPAIIRDGRPMVVVTTPMVPPEVMQRKQIKIELEDGSTIRDIAAVLSNLGYSVVIEDKAAAEAEVIVPKYQGTLGGLFRAMQTAGDVWFTWDNGAVVISSTARVEISLPQEQKLADRIAKGLTNYGLEKTPVSAEAGIVSLKLKPSQYVAVRNYLTRITHNAALVNMQVALVNVVLTQDASKGFDWNKLQVAAGGGSNLLATLNPQTGQNLSNGQNSSNLNGLNGTNGTGTTGTTGTSGTTGSTALTNPNDITYVTPGGSTITSTTNGGTPVTTVLANTGAGALLSNGGLRGVISDGAFSMIGFVNFLENYGSTKTLQSVMLRTVTGRSVELKSVTKIPYVSNVGVGGYGQNGGSYGSSGSTGTGGTGGNSNTVTGFGDTGTGTGSANTGPYSAAAQQNNQNLASGYGGLLGSANTSTANDGITLKLLPAYDEASEAVTVDIALSVEAVLSFNTLSAGNQIGQLSQPTTAQQTFNDTIRVRPGQTVVVGGLTYDQITRSSAVPLFLPDSAKSSTLAVKRTALFIVVRPTVTVLGSLKDDTAQLFAAGDDTSAPQEQQSDVVAIPPAMPAALPKPIPSPSTIH